MTVLMLKHKGFSLIEVLIAITILGFISLGIATFTDSSISSSIRITGEDIESLQIETAMSRLEWDVSHSYTPLYFEQPMDPQGMTPEEGEIYNQLADYYQTNQNFNLLSFSGLPAPLVQVPEKGSLIFFAASNRRKVVNVKQSNYNWIKYELVPDELTEEQKEAAKVPTKMLIRKAFAQDVYTPEQINWEDVKSQVLFHKVLKMDFEFWDYQKEKWNSSLNVIEQGNNILRGIKVTLEYLDANNNEAVSVRVFRPLYPYLKPEDMYKFLKAKAPQGLNPDGTNGGNND